MKIVLFDLGETLESNDVLLPGARETLEGIRGLRDAAGQPACVMGIVSNSEMPSDPAEIPAVRREYRDLLSALGILDLFEPLAQRLTISAEIGVGKPDARIFSAAIEKLDPTLGFQDALFVTENLSHVRAARRLGMKAIHFRGPSQTSGEVSRLTDLVPLVRRFLEATPGGRGSATRIAISDALAAVEGGRLETPSDVTWVRFGNQTLVLAEGDDPAATALYAKAAGLRLGGDVLEAPRERLHLVVQNGRLFQHEHPEVRVVLDRGRFLAVDIEPGRARRLNAENETCFSVRHLEDDTVVFEELHVESAREEALPRVQSLVGRLSRPRYEADLTRLASMPTRLSSGAQFLAAAEEARAAFEASNYAARLENVALSPGKSSRNVIADKAGSGAGARGVVIVCAHLDSINQEGGTAAPGADDNASGSAGVLEMGRVFREHRGVHDLRFILFGGEEQGLCGSKQYVANLPAAERSRVRAVVNMDMIGARNRDTDGNVVPRGVLLEGDPISQRVVERLGVAAATYTSLKVYKSFHPANSDHVSFIDAGIPAVLTIEAADASNPNVHSARDTLDRIDFELALDILRMNVAFVAEEVGTFE